MTKKQISSKEKVKLLWDSCIHSYIGAFTLTEEKRAIELIEKKLMEFEQQTAKEIINKLLKIYTNCASEFIPKEMIISDLKEELKEFLK